MDRDDKRPYMIRWQLIKDKIDTLSQSRDLRFNIYLHKIMLSDEPVLHDHPWNYATLILKGGYYEHTPEGKFWRGPGHFRYRKSTDLHRLELAKDENGNELPCWSLSYMGKKVQEWGFIKNGKRIHNETYLAERDKATV